ncbi:MBL fold metallo-hydrolase [Streptomyces phaeochromogenes]|uniref:MBL fold metallo-hydrolase n=1 Tax=Streptomyces phaeochromogenes TaxID=1923 RepID=UPI00386E211A|nr:MBL fold metallo-hydrolase [Streptomyces phaeochromogenes]
MPQLLRVGEVDIVPLLEWQGTFITRGTLLPSSDAAEWSDNASWLDPTFWSAQTDGVPLHSRSYVIRSDGQLILVDTGIGNGKNRPQVPPFNGLDTDYLSRLCDEIGDVEAVDVVINTHIHQDHVGWNTRLVDGQWRPTFPRATYLLPGADYEEWNRSRGSDAGADEVFLDSVLPVVDTGQASFYTGERVVDQNITIVAAPGHSPGSSVVMIVSAGESAVITGDIVHTPMQLAHPEQHLVFDADPVRAVSSRRTVLAAVADAGSIMLPAHFGRAGGLWLTRDGSGFSIAEWVPLTAE